MYVRSVIVIVHHLENANGRYESKVDTAVRPLGLRIEGRARRDRIINRFGVSNRQREVSQGESWPVRTDELLESRECLKCGGDLRLTLVSGPAADDCVET